MAGIKKVTWPPEQPQKDSKNKLSQVEVTKSRKAIKMMINIHVGDAVSHTPHKHTHM